MKGTAATLLAFLQKLPLFAIPLCRHTDILAIEKEAEGLLDEIIGGSN